LDPVKNFDKLIDIFADLAPRFPDWDLLILGEGSQRKKLESQISQLGLYQRVNLPGALEDPFPFFRGADAFVLSSEREGFPLAVVEAMVCKVAVIATNCSPAIGEILENGNLGIIVPCDNPKALAKGLSNLMEDTTLRERMSNEAIRVAQQFAPGNILDSWENLIQESIYETD